ncbi:MAG: TerB family tellurite resistance protein [Gammaproteobacteria bacterium]|nr:TerB family tellurite resistance protein [Gammaproteobacteria bacterium]
MLGRIKNILLADRAYAESATDPDERQQLALAALLLEMARADFDESSDEQLAIRGFLATHFELTEAEAGALMDRAAKAMDESVCLFDFTRALHDSLDYEQKLEVVRLLWRTALADDRLDKYEEYLIRKVADLLYVSNGDIIRLRNEERD